MEERIARLKTSQEARQLAENAHRLGHSNWHALALQRARELKAAEEGYTTPAQQAIATALYAYEEEQSRLKGRTFRATRTRQMLARHGALVAVERMVLNRQPSKGFQVLEDAGLQELSFEAIVDRYPDEFTSVAVEAARARLNDEPHPQQAVASPEPLASESDEYTPVPTLLDGEALRFLHGFRDAGNRIWTRWMPRYRAAIQAIEQALSDDRPQDLLIPLWKQRDNGISDAGQGMLPYSTVDEMHDEIVNVIREIHQDSSFTNYDRIIERFKGWKADGLINTVPHLLIARAFAGIHPHYYHTIVDSHKQNQALKWFVEHSGFVMPSDQSWGARAQALVAHLDHVEVFQGDILARNVFPWFVFEQLRARMRSEIPPGHTQKAAAAFANLPPAQRVIELRHNSVQNALFAQLAKQYGESNVWTERPTGTGGYADAVVRRKDGRLELYEIKIAQSAAEVVRQAMGQLLEYGFREGGIEPVMLFAVGEHPLDKVTQSFLTRLRIDFNLAIEYVQINVPDEL